MRILWDEPKRQENVRKHGFDFADLDPDFFADAVLIGVKQGRLLVAGRHAKTVIAVVFSPLGTEAISVISARRANKKERAML